MSLLTDKRAEAQSLAEKRMESNTDEQVLLLTEDGEVLTIEEGGALVVELDTL